MRRAGTGDCVRDFAEEVLRSGFMLIELLDNLVESLPEDTFSGKANVEVALEMLIGTIGLAATAAGEKSVRSAAAPLADSSARTVADLERAGELARRRECGPAGGVATGALADGGV